MKSSTQAEKQALGFLVGFCYLVSLSLSLTGIYALMQLALAAAGGVASEIYPAPELF